MNSQEIKEIIADQNKALPADEGLIARDAFAEIESNIANPFIIVISGIRRCGKSTLLNQIRAKHDGYYFNFDDDRLVNFTVEDFQMLYECFIELYGKKRFFYFDEVQNIQGWERFVRRLYDNKMKVFATGSNASMMSRELGTKLTGRHLQINLFPFSFKEFLRLKQLNFGKKQVFATEEKAVLKKHFEEFLYNGGLPEFLKTQNKEYLKTLFESILYRDIIVRHNLSNEKTMKELVSLATTSVSKEISFNSIKKSLGLGSSTTVKEYFNYLENSFLIFLLSKFDYSLKKQVFANKKAFIIDNALAAYLGHKISKDSGKLLENLVFIELKRRKKEVYYFSGRNECDFVVKEKNRISKAVQVCYSLEKDNEKREVNGLIEALKKFKLKEGLLLTSEGEKEMKIENKTIKIKPVWKWLLENQA